MEIPKVVLDTNIFISMLIGGSVSNLLYARFVKNKFTVVISHPLIAELLETLKKDRLRKLFFSEDIADLFKLILLDTIIILPRHRIADCRDPKDNIVLECASEGGANFIISGDKDLLSLSPYKGVLIIKPSEFLNILNGV